VAVDRAGATFHRVSNRFAVLLRALGACTTPTGAHAVRGFFNSDTTPPVSFTILP
jgi:hypothetical protein